jgi:hypothetical protein
MKNIAFLLTFAFLGGCHDERHQSADIGVTISVIANLNRRLVNLQEVDPNFIPDKHFSGMLAQVADGDPVDFSKHLQHGQLFYVGGRLPSNTKAIRLLFTTEMASVIYFSDGSYLKFKSEEQVNPRANQ